jgi:hypothetical protein
MATRSFIAHTNGRTGFNAIYCHWDGYPSHHLPILREEYSTARKVQNLLKLGDLSCLKTDKDWQRQQLPEERPLSYAERGENCPSRYYDSIEELRQAAKDYGAEYVYIYMNRYGWSFNEL